MNRKQDLKRCAIRYMGGKCIICGYNRCSRALHFHHIDPSKKDFDISKENYWTNIEIELEKCVLLCSNCHMEVHSNMISTDRLNREKKI